MRERYAADDGHDDVTGQDPPDDSGVIDEPPGSRPPSALRTPRTA